MYTPEQLREIVAELKGLLKSPDLPFGVDLALPQVGGNARKTNHDYTGGKLDELIDITIESGMMYPGLFIFTLYSSPPPLPKTKGGVVRGRNKPKEVLLTTIPFHQAHASLFLPSACPPNTSLTGCTTPESTS